MNEKTNFRRPETTTVALRALSPPTEYSEQFLQGMLNRIAISCHKYGLIADNFPDRVHAIDSAIQRIDQYHRTQNTEFLIDAANFLMFEFIHPLLPGAHFTATDSRHSPGITMGDGSITSVGSDA